MTRPLRPPPLALNCHRNFFFVFEKSVFFLNGPALNPPSLLLFLRHPLYRSGIYSVSYWMLSWYFDMHASFTNHSITSHFIYFYSFFLKFRIYILKSCCFADFADVSQYFPFVLSLLSKCLFFFYFSLCFLL